MEPGQRAGGAPQQRRDRRAVTRSAARVAQQRHSLHAARSKERAATAAHLVTSEAAQRPSACAQPTREPRTSWLVTSSKEQVARLRSGRAARAKRAEHASAAQRAHNLCEHACDIMSHPILLTCI